ncbi:hypothetical protein AQUCO_01400536v1 [Aquilegia coerulea]|uniref:Uncharacterized protein n=1 Tax=Aquilegia coerulea TaxID=218851 RepID=A0A2G5DWY4_AQUCA|nr:hypothetical protein AQUCO_01400536v1 [Aquilegia coerulea]
MHSCIILEFFLCQYSIIIAIITIYIGTGIARLKERSLDSKIKSKVTLDTELQFLSTNFVTKRRCSQIGDLIWCIRHDHDI